MISELAQFCMNARAKQNKWAIMTYPKQISMPKDLFEPITEPGEEQKVCE